MADLRWEVRVGNSLDLLRTLPDNSIAAIVCDPPYELGFMGKSWDSSGIAYSVPLWTEALRALKPGGHLLAFGGSRTYHRLAVAIEDAGFQIRDSLVWIYGSGFPKSLNVAKGGAGEAWSGWGTALKPAQEPIVMARKPLAGTIAANVLAHGTGAINVDGCRVPHAGASDLSGASDVSAAGRWPANVLLSHAEDCGDGCADGCPVAEMDRQSGERPSKAARHGTRGGRGFGNFDHEKSAHATGRWPADPGGGASRFFYAAKPSTRERDAGLGHLPTRAGHEVCGRKEGSAGASNPRAGIQTARRNVHPTVKPIAVMRYLVRLITPPGGLVLDPFCGSGTTGCAAVLEGARFVGLELSPEYAEIARARIAHWKPTQEALWRDHAGA